MTVGAVLGEPMVSGAARSPLPALAGIGLRAPHLREILDDQPEVAWYEVHSENVLGGGAGPRALEALRRDHGLSLHGVGLSLGSPEGLSREHLARLRALADRLEPGLVSDHLSWSVVDGLYLADLLPLPLTGESLEVVCRNVEAAQETLGRRLLVENPSTYPRFRHSTIPEAEFLAEVVRRTGCGLLYDVNNIYVSCCNHGWDARAYLAALPGEAVGEIHVAGHAVRPLEGGRVLRIDDHGSPVPYTVWALLDEALALWRPRPVLVEWDTDLPPLEVLLAEARRAGAALAEARHAIAA